MVQNIKRLPGRPRLFDADQTLDQAIRVFWRKGYEGATIDDLTEATGLSRPSLYNAFGDKEALFMRCLERYVATIGSLAVQSMDAAGGAREAVCAYLRQAALNATGEGCPSGCLIACVVPAVENSSVRAFLAVAMAASDGAIAARLALGVASGELPSDFPVAQRARCVTDLSMALAVRARGGASRVELLETAAEGAALALDMPG
jgi:AcrR family transcriptional regulator